jgi:rubrerythrin
MRLRDYIKKGQAKLRKKEPTMKCPKCGQERIEKIKHCPVCGEKRDA